MCLEDDLDDFDFITETLERSGFRCVANRVHDRESFINSMATFKPDIILSDHALPQFDSIEALVVSKAALPHVPFILVTGAVSDEFAVKTLKLGADDYVLKSNMSRLPSAIRNAMRHREAEIAKVRAAQELANRNQELLRINRELDSFVYSISHDLRAPLMSVLGLTNLAKRETNMEALSKYNELIESSVVKLDSTLKEIIEYARSARQDVKHELIDFHEILYDTLHKLEFMPGFSDIETKIEIQSTAPFYSDRYRLSVIFNNLISNAVKYSDRSKEKSFLEVRINSDPEKTTLVFRDNGIGIDKGILSKIFDMFFRGTESRDGAGLGLYIVQEAVRMLRGHIDVDSRLGDGTTFTIRVPNVT